MRPEGCAGASLLADSIVAAPAMRDPSSGGSGGRIRETNRRAFDRVRAMLRRLERSPGGTRAEGTSRCWRMDREWTFLTNHAHVLVCLARDPYAAVGPLAQQVGIDDDAVDEILRDLVGSGYVLEQRERGRLVRRVVARGLPLRHPVEAHHSVGRLLDAVQSAADVLAVRIRGGD